MNYMTVMGIYCICLTGILTYMLLSVLPGMAKRATVAERAAVRAGSVLETQMELNTSLRHANQELREINKNLIGLCERANDAMNGRPSAGERVAGEG